MKPISNDSDETVQTSANESYHEKILTLLKIQNNSTLNNIYYKTIPSIKKAPLLNLDLSASPADKFAKEFEDSVLPEKLLKSRNFTEGFICNL